MVDDVDNLLVHIGELLKLFHVYVYIQFLNNSIKLVSDFKTL